MKHVKNITTKIDIHEVLTEECFSFYNRHLLQGKFIYFFKTFVEDVVDIGSDCGGGGGAVYNSVTYRVLTHPDTCFGNNKLTFITIHLFGNLVNIPTCPG